MSNIQWASDRQEILHHISFSYSQIRRFKMILKSLLLRPLESKGTIHSEK